MHAEVHSSSQQYAAEMHQRKSNLLAFDNREAHAQIFDKEDQANLKKLNLTQDNDAESAVAKSADK